MAGPGSAGASSAGEAEAAPASFDGPLAVVGIALGCGLAAGLLEVAAVPVRGLFDPRVTDDLLRLNRHAGWMAPLADLALFGAIGLAMAAVAVRWPRLAARLTTGLGVGLGSLALLLTTRVLHPVAALLLAAGIACRVAPWLHRRPRGFRRLVGWGLPVLAMAAGTLGVVEYRRVLGAESRALAALPEPAVDRPNVLLIVMDTVRADHLGLYGYDRPTSTHLDRLAARGVRFAEARSAAPWTLPSHASMFTGRWPHELSVDGERPLDRAEPTLAEALAARGYATAGFVANTHYCNARFGLDRGFARYDDYVENRQVNALEIARSAELGRRLLGLLAEIGLAPPLGDALRKDAARINAELLGWLDDRPADRPFFAFLNYYDAHDPYIAPPWAPRRFGLVPETAADHELLAGWLKLSKWTIPDREIALARDAYDDCIAALDSQLGRLVAELDRRGLLDETLIVVTADHGESWGEHQLYGHWRSLYRPEVHVPLVVVGPGVPADRAVDAPVSLRDLPATILDLAADADASPLPGRSLATAWADGPAEAPGPVYSEMTYRAGGDRGKLLASLGPTRSIIDDGKVYIQGAFGREELYDLADLDEARNLAATTAARPLLLHFRDLLARFNGTGRAPKGDAPEDD